MYYYVPFYYYIKFVVQLLSCVRLSATLWTAAHQASPSFIISQSLLKLMSIKSVMQSNHLILCHSLLLPSIFPSTWGLFQWVSSSHEVAKVLEVPFLCQSFQWTQDWFALGSTGWTSLVSKGLSRVFSSVTVQKHLFFIAQPSLWFSSHICNDNWRNHSFLSVDLYGKVKIVILIKTNL